MDGYGNDMDMDTQLKIRMSEVVSLCQCLYKCQGTLQEIDAMLSHH